MLATRDVHNTEITKDLRTSLGDWLRMRRLRQGLSQRDLAAKLNLDYYTFISQLENGRGKIPPGRYREWADALGVDTKAFVIKLLSFYDPITYDILNLETLDHGQGD